MALVASGQLSLGDINQEFGFSRITPIKLLLQDSGGSKQVRINNGWVTLNPCSTYQPNTSTPHTISEWYRYDHNELCPTTTTTTTSTTTTLPPCISITGFVHVINGVENGDGFTLDGGVQDINISFNSYSPSGYSTPLLYEYILDGFSTTIVTSSTKNFPSVNVGSHTLTIRVYNCGVFFEKTIGFTINASTTTTTTSTTTTSTTTTTTSTTTGTICNPITSATINGATTINTLENFALSVSSLNGTPPYVISWEIRFSNGRTVNFTNSSGWAIATYCENIGVGQYDLTITNCNGASYQSLNNSFTILAPNLPTPLLLSPCKYFDGVFKSDLTATGYNSTSVLAVYDADTGTFIGNMTNGVLTVLVTTQTDRYKVRSELCGYVSGWSNTTEIYFTIPNC